VSVAHQTHQRPLPPIPRITPVSGKRVAPTVGADRANLGAFRLLDALWVWSAGEDGFPHPPGGSTLAVGRQKGRQIMDSVYCRDCGQPLSLEPVDTPRQPCPNCGSTSRTFSKQIESTVGFSSYLMGQALRGDQPVGFVESERPDLTRHATLTPDGGILLNLRGLSPRNEQDSDMVCEALVSALNASGLRVKLIDRGEQDEDFILAINGARIGVQVVRALTDPDFWKALARSGEVNDLYLTIPEAVSALRSAIEHKTTIPKQQRLGLILLLDAYRLPALALGPVIDQFKREQTSWTRSLGFYAVYLVGPTATFVSRLDERNPTQLPPNTAWCDTRLLV